MLCMPAGCCWQRSGINLADAAQLRGAHNHAGGMLIRRWHAQLQLRHCLSLENRHVLFENTSIIRKTIYACRMPLYYEAKLLFVIWLWHPKSRGAVYLYTHTLQVESLQHNVLLRR